MMQWIDVFRPANSCVLRLLRRSILQWFLKNVMSLEVVSNRSTQTDSERPTQALNAFFDSCHIGGGKTQAES